MEIVFKNGNVIQITKEIAKVLNDRILSGSKQWQNFSNENGIVFLMINLDAVSYVLDSEIMKDALKNEKK